MYSDWEWGQAALVQSSLATNCGEVPRDGDNSTGPGPQITRTHTALPVRGRGKGEQAEHYKVSAGGCWLKAVLHREATPVKESMWVGGGKARSWLYVPKSSARMSVSPRSPGCGGGTPMP
eukprot:TRINITY_DN26523_c0_g1_i1.p1 TRINITY_DN26523_c0_g1~~TRINITY_DN26523_c0_g1_i1.p1  ORF type:complete len:120 (+),score=4.26 TRINITY_DN26523_c0_g1_i1:403-762(+)